MLEGPERTLRLSKTLCINSVSLTTRMSLTINKQPSALEAVDNDAEKIEIYIDKNADISHQYVLSSRPKRNSESVGKSICVFVQL